MYALLVLADVITGSPAQGPVPAETVVAHAKLGFDAVEVRRLDDQENGTYRLAVRVGDGWWNGPGHLVPPHDGHTCHDDASKVKSVKLKRLALPSKHRAVVAQIDVDFTMYMTCPENPPWKSVPVDSWTERTFLVCAETADKKISCASIMTRTRDACTAKATLTGNTLDTPCEANWNDEQDAAHDLGRGKHTLDF